MHKNKLFIIFLVWMVPIPASGDALSKALKLLELTKAQGTCSSYIASMYSDYKGAGFASDEEAKRIQHEHLQLASDAAEEFVELAISQDLDGIRMVFKKGNLICFGDACFAKREYIEAVLLMAGLVDAQKEVNEKSISCPEGAWLPCSGREPVDNRYYKARDFYKNKNCSLLVP